MKKLLTIFILITVFSCKEKSGFQHQILEGSILWTHEKFDVSAEKFTFALFSDLTGGEREGIFEVAVAQLNLLRPERIINVGDLIDGTYKTLDELNKQWDPFDSRVDKATAPVFYVGGNHDLTNEEMRKGLG